MNIGNAANLAPEGYFNKDPVDVTQLVMDRYFINELTKELENKNKELAYRWKELQRKCMHPTIKTIEKYNSGGYDYVSSIHITKTCTTCNKVLESYKDPNHRGMYE